MKICFIYVGELLSFNGEEIKWLYDLWISGKRIIPEKEQVLELTRLYMMTDTKKY